MANQRFGALAEGVTETFDVDNLWDRNTPGKLENVQGKICETEGCLNPIEGASRKASEAKKFRDLYGDDPSSLLP